MPADIPTITRDQASPKESHYTQTDLLSPTPTGTQIPFLKDLIKPYARVLNLEAGPGETTIALALRFPEATFYGLNPDADRVNWAQFQAKERNITNTRFVEAQSGQTPFPDGYFHLVYSNAFLLQAPKAAKVIQEAFRVLAPWGAIATREMDIQASYLTPANPQGPSALDMLGRLIHQSGGNPLIGRHLKTYLLNAGFSKVTAGASPEFFDSPEDIANLKRFLTAKALSQHNENMATKLKICTPGQFDEWRQQVTRWANRPSATACLHFGHAVGYRLTL